MSSNDKLSARFGGIQSNAEGEERHIGATILAEGPGGGFYSLPWVLDDYERAMNLTPAESWLLRRMLKYSWNDGTLVFISMTKITQQAKISRSTLWKLIRELRLKGFVTEAKRGPFGNPVVYYDVSNVWRALWTCIQCSPFSKLRADGAGWNIKRAQEYAQLHGFDLDWNVLAGDQKSERAQAKRKRSSDKEKIEALKSAIDDVYSDCHNYEPFTWYSRKNYAALLDMVQAGVTPGHVRAMAQRLDDDGMPENGRKLADALIASLNGKRRR